MDSTRSLGALEAPVPRLTADEHRALRRRLFAALDSIRAMLPHLSHGRLFWFLLYALRDWSERRRRLG